MVERAKGAGFVILRSGDPTPLLPCLLCYFTSQSGRLVYQRRAVCNSAYGVMHITEPLLSFEKSRGLARQRVPLMTP